MKITAPIAASLLFLSLFFSPVGASVPVPSPPSIAGEAYYLMEARTGRVLAEHNAEARIPPASLTKIMTAYVVYNALEDDSISLEDQVRVSEAAWRLGGSQMFIEVGTYVTVDELLNGMVVQSGNDASMALAEHVAGSESSFVEIMNTYAQRLGLENTRFANSSGLPSEEAQYTTARDMAMLAQALIREFPQHYTRYSQREFTYNNIRQHNRNELLWRDDSVDGVKTGHTSESGYALVSSAQRDDMRLVSAVLGSPSVQRRADDSAALLSWGFRFFETHRLFAQGRSIEAARIWEGETDTVDLGPAEDVFVTVPRGAYNQLAAEMSFPGTLVAPVARGDEVGDVVVTLDGEVVARAPVIALEDVARGGLFRRLIERARQWFE